MRDALRASLRDARRRMSHETRRKANERLVERLGALLGDVEGEAIAVYWPIHDEPALDPLPERWARSGARLALPLVVARDTPLRFLAWRPGEPTIAGPWGIPRPVREETVRPSLLVIPCLGFDARGYRLGYGGGYYDRSLAALDADGGVVPRAIGVAWDEALLETFEPLCTDRRLDAVLTPSRTFPPAAHPAR